MAQIQYAAYTSPPVAAVSPPTVDQLGWRPSIPDQTQYASRGRFPPGRLMAALQTVGAVVFAVEQFALPVPKVAEAYVPTNPQQLTSRTATHSGKGVGAYTALYAPWVAFDFAPENWALPVPKVAAFYGPDALRPRWSPGGGKGIRDYTAVWLPAAILTDDLEDRTVTFGATAELPDSPQQFVRRWPTELRQGFTRDLTVPSAAQTGTDWMTAWPARTFARQLRPQILTDVDVMAPEFFPPTLEWSAVYPDTTARAHLPIALYPSYMSGEDATEISQWSTIYPNWTLRARLPVALYPSLFRGEAVERFDATLLWSASYPDTTRRAQLPTAALPFVFRDDTPEQFAPVLQWSVCAPDRTPRRAPALLTAQLPFWTSGQAIDKFNATLLWNAFYPATTSRTRLGASAMPSVFTGESLEHFAPVLQWAVIAPSTTRANRLAPADYPWFGSPIAPVFFVGQPILTFPDGTRRLALHTAQLPSLFWDVITPQVPSTFYSGQLPLVFSSSILLPTGIVAERRPTENPGDVGSRSPTTREPGL